MNCNDFKATEYNTPFITQRADPFLCQRPGGGYYFLGSVPEYDRIALRQADPLAQLPGAQERVLWTRHESGPQSLHIWAPELHYLFGGWYIYYAAGDKDDEWAIRPYVLHCKGDDPMADEWEELGMMHAAADDEFSFHAFSLDMTVFEADGVPYCIWAEKVGVGKQISNLYIGKLSAANELETVQVLLTTPDYAWERHGFWVNEGPAVLFHDGKIFVTFSASDTGAAYCMGELWAKVGDDLLDPANWTKKNRPVLATDWEKGIFGPGHNCFTKDEDGADICVFHARQYDEIIGNPLYDPNRHAMILRMEYDAEGFPVFDLSNIRSIA